MFAIVLVAVFGVILFITVELFLSRQRTQGESIIPQDKGKARKIVNAARILGVALMGLALLVVLAGGGVAEQEKREAQQEMGRYAKVLFWCVQTDNLRAVITTPTELIDQVCEAQMKVDRLWALSLVTCDSSSTKTPYCIQSHRLYSGSTEVPGLFHTGIFSKAGHVEDLDARVYIRYPPTDTVWDDARFTLEEKTPSSTCAPPFDAPKFYRIGVEIDKSGQFEVQVSSTAKGWSLGFPPSFVENYPHLFSKGINSYRQVIAVADGARAAYHISFDLAEVSRHIDNYGDLFRDLVNGGTVIRKDSLPAGLEPKDLHTWYLDTAFVYQASRCKSWYEIEETRQPRDVEGLLFFHSDFPPVSAKLMMAER